MEQRRITFFISPERLMVGSFLLMILVGTLLLMFPFATKRGYISPIDALFTSTSAVCVTGLVVVDTGKYFTFWGQLMVLLLIQVGGLGIVTFSVFFYRLLGWDVPLREKMAIEETFAYTPVKDVFRVVKAVFIYTVVIESLGAGALFLRWIHGFPPKEAAFLSLFHTISAFCNAGFSPFSDSLARFRGDMATNLIFAALIVSGGIGFVVLQEVRNKGLRPRRLSLHTKVVIVTSAALIVAGALLFFLTEIRYLLQGMTWKERILVPFFQSVTARTAGFSTVEIASLHPSTLFFLILLMFIGASPGSCGGGVKTTNLALLFALAFGRLRGREEAVLFKRALPRETVARSISILLAAMTFIVFSLIALLLLEERNLTATLGDEVFLRSLFDLVSAFGTVGLFTGVVPHLSVAGKALFIVTMFTGRLGPLTLACALARRGAEAEFHYMEEKIMVG